MPLTKLIQLMEEKLGKDVITEEVTEDFKAQVDVLINEQVKGKVSVLEEELKEKYRDDAEKFKTDLIENIDAYMDYAAKEFLKENAVAIESEYKVKAAEDLIEGIASIMENNHFTIEPAKNKSLDEAKAKLVKATKELNESKKKNIENEKQLFEYEKAIAFKEMTEGFTKVKVEKALELLEGLEFSTIKDFKKKLSIVVEKVTSKPSEKKKEELKEDVKQSHDIDKYLQ